MFRSYKYRLFPNKQQSDDLDRVLEIHRTLYNDALTERREALCVQALTWPVGACVA